MVMEPMRERSEMKATPASVEHDTLPSQRSAPLSFPIEEYISPNEQTQEVQQLEARLERLMAENRDLMNERHALNAIAKDRAERSNECLAVARNARLLIRAYVNACKACSNGEKLAGDTANAAYDALVAFIDKPL